jgi:hypothetical protein
MVRPIARKWNLGYTFETGGTLQTGITVRCVLRHVNGHVERGDAMPLPLENSGSKNNVQGVGSSVSFGKRYTLQNAFAIVAEGADTDGHDPALVVSLPHEREQLVLSEAQAAFDAGTYLDWFNGQSPKDRAWLIGHGHHAGFGGPALPAPKPKAEQGEGSAGTHAKNQQAKGADKPADPDAQRADWVRRYVGKMDAAGDLDAISELQATHEETLGKLRAGYPDLIAQIDRATDRARERAQ